ncbi:3-phosphoshikimate 1-carboxyvinyltransferase [Homoserinibacter sp. GY 40078]|uniref:3-phosphoshikimate 1-carboxyvinyltransferase n=1 Tax=Homoserinibacter sp. GY 40078 TaxID=2603275 RepID=UPI0011CBB0B9|nr:3-phosphoshikimate 1-carboxyvinyltransferase [Homoserinibacter sp. GY 40078]TXK17202.1 3-phosphoshikimate 1-carboxyvinyltransferase [Homoserinibacter sp. GY 40078]
MGVLRYSGRDELILGLGARPEETDPVTGDILAPPSESGPWSAPTAEAPLAARLTLPGSKSLTNRELVLAALADGPSTIRRPLHSRDTSLMVDGLRALGIDIAEVPGDGDFGPDLRVTPGELLGGTIDGGLAGTVMRFLPIVAALALGPTNVDGDPYARKRPMRTTIDALRGIGVEVNDDGRGTMPFTVHGTGEVIGGDLAIDASASSQFVSGLLLAAPRFRDGLTLRHTGERLPSMPHIRMTIACLAAHGVQVDEPEEGVWHVAPQPIRARDVDIEPDLSNAGPFLAAALLAGGTVTIDGWPEQTTQVGDEFLRILPRLGATVTRTGDAVTVDGGAGVRGGGVVRAADLDLTIGGELAPTFAILLAFADGPSRLTGIGHLRGHETDRLAALVAEIRRLGGDADELEDGLEVRPAPLHGGAWEAYADHRIATAGALAGLIVPGVTVDDIGTTAKTLPEFPELWNAMLGRGAHATRWEQLPL